jgi:hypothetical protein
MGDVFPGVSETEWNRARAYINDVAPLLGLRHWKFELHRTPADDPEVFAMIGCTIGRDYGNVYLGVKWGTLSPGDKRETLIHELLHAALMEYETFNAAAIGKLAGHGALEAIEAMLNETLERTVERIATGIAPMLPPYPVEPAKRPARRAKRKRARKAKR